ncbi:MAG: DUF748 domain-containing protein [Gammaproteobacteria bacterium]|nr:DUF748 domain-containing protein [Gammaproteobacteria bacterium]
MSETLYKRTWFKWLTSLAILFLLFISFLPLGIRYVIVDWFENQNVAYVSLEDVNLNLFTGNLALINMLVKSEDQDALVIDTINIDFDWLPLFKKRSFFPALKINKLRLLVKQNPDNSLVIAGIKIPKSENKTDTNEDNQWGFGLHSIEVLSSEIIIHTPKQHTSLSLNQIQLNKLASWSEESSQLDFQGKINGADVSINGELALFAKQPGFNGTVTVKDLDLSPLAIYLKKQVHELSGKLDLETRINATHTPGKSTDIETSSRVLFKNLVIHLPSQEINQDKLLWQGSSKLHLEADNEPPEYHITGELSSENLTLKPDQQYRYHHGSLNWKGRIHSQPGTNIPTITGNVKGRDISATQVADQMQLFNTTTLTVENINFKNIDDLQVDQIKLNTARSLFTPASDKKDQQPAFIQAGNINIKHISLQPENNIKIGLINLDDALVYLHILKNGTLQSFPVTDNKNQEQKSETVNNNKTATPLKLSLTEFSLTGNSHVHVLDESVTPSFKTELEITKAVINNITTASPESASPFIISANLDKYSSIKFSGDAYPFSKPLSLKLVSNIKNISLPPVSSYTSRSIGYNLISGQLNADITLNITKGEINAVNKLLISNLEVKPSDPEKSASLTSQISMPLDSALSLLRNKNNDIKLNIPVTGNINKPDFNISGIINKALGSALKKTTMTYLTLALQPYGALITLAKMADSASNAVNLNPISFKNNSSLVENDARLYIKKIAGLMQERPKLRIKLCGKAVNQDREQIIQQKQKAWILKQKSMVRTKNTDPVELKKSLTPPAFKIPDDSLLSLALKRADSIKEILVNEYKIGADRLFLCNPAIDPDKKAKARLDITI